MRYHSKPEVKKAATIYFGFPLLSNDDVVRSTLRRSLENYQMVVTSTWSADQGGLLLKLDVERQAFGSGKAQTSSHWVRFKASRRYANLRIKFHEAIAAQPWVESYSRVRGKALRDMAGVAIRINNHFKVPSTGKYHVRHGSGFFYKSRNQIMTAWHNLRANNDCRRIQRCKLYFMHTDRRGVTRKFSQTVTITSFSQEDDFAILRLKTPADISARVLPIAREWIRPEVSIIGYPMPGFSLLYSHGYINGLTRGTRRLVASAHVVGGYSGAPIVDRERGTILGFAKEWQRPKGQPGTGGPVSLNLIRVLEQRYGF